MQNPIAESPEVQRTILTNSIREIDAEENPYLWVVAYCLCKGIQKINEIPKPISVPIGDFTLLINGKNDVVSGIPPLGMQIRYKGVETGWLQFDEYYLPMTYHEHLKITIVDALLDLLHELKIA